ncbi:stage V sporulation protein E [soil metagenome]
MLGYRSVPGATVSSTRRTAETVRQRPAPTESSSRRHKPDSPLLLLSILLLVIGLVVVYAIGPALSASSGGHGSNYVVHQLVAIGLSIVAFIVMARIPLNQWSRLQKPLIIAAVAATALAVVLPVNPEYPAHRWVRLGGFSFQSVELVKFALIIWLSGFLAMQVNKDLITDAKSTFKPLLLILAVGGFIIAGVQSDLGSAGVLVMMVGTMAFVAGLPMRRIMLFGAVIAIGVVLAVAVAPYRRDRLLAFMHPEANCQTTGYQACQALIAVGSGGIAGLGLGKSVQAYGYLPEAANDSIFAIYAEKFGLIGCIVLLLLFGMLFARLSKIAERTADLRNQLIVIGVLTWLSVQAIINIGAMIGLLPLKGITLPFVSYGGTSVVFVAAAIGLVFQISSYAAYQSPLEGRKGQSYDNSSNGRRIGRAHYANLSGRR